MVIKEITQADEKTKITKEIMHALPEWFSPPEDIENKSRIHRSFPFFAAYDNDEVLGFITLKKHNEYTAEIYKIGVLKPYHGKSYGSQLMHKALDYCRIHNIQYLTVKTLDESADYEPYNKTRDFYQKNGFIPLEVLRDYWNEENPCLFMARRI